MKKYFIIVILLISGIYSNAQQQAVPFTLDDRERLIRIAATLDSMRNDMNSLPNEMNNLSNEMNTNFDFIDKGFEKMDRRFDEILVKLDYVIWILWLIIALLVFTIGFIFYDRHSTLTTLKRN
jgi:hypothetical protein